MECAFGMLVQKWGLLRTAMPRGISMKKIIALINALAKLHNFCIDQVDKGGEMERDVEEMEQSTLQNTFNMMGGSSGFVELEDGGTFVVPRQLLDSGNHFDDVPRNRRIYQGPGGGEGMLAEKLPRSKLHEQVIDSHKVRPSTRAK